MLLNAMIVLNVVLSIWVGIKAWKRKKRFSTHEGMVMMESIAVIFSVIVCLLFLATLYIVNTEGV